MEETAGQAERRRRTAEIREELDELKAQGLMGGSRYARPLIQELKELRNEDAREKREAEIAAMTTTEIVDRAMGLGR